MDDLLKMFPGKGAQGEGPIPGDAMPRLSEAEMERLGGEEGLREHMARVWEHLDDLAERDPEEYRRFLAQQAEGAGVKTSGGKGSAGPRRRAPASASAAVFQGSAPCLSVLTRRRAGGGMGAAPPPSSSGASEVVVCIWGSPEMPPVEGLGAAGPQVPVGLRQAVPEGLPPAACAPAEVGAAGARVFHVECHPGALAAAAAGDPAGFRELLVERSFQWVETVHSIALSRRGRRLFFAEEADPTGAFPVAPRGGPGGRALEARDAAAGTAAEAMSDGLLGDLAGMTARALESPAPGGPGPARGPSTGPAQEGKKPKMALIEELEPETLQYELEERRDPGGHPIELRVAVEAPPGTVSARELRLEVAKGRLAVTAPGGATLDLALPAWADANGARARFDKKTRRLRVTLPPRPAPDR